MVSLYQDQDRLLLHKLQEGCVESFNILYDKYWREVYTNAMKRLNNHSQAQDITQDIFAYMWFKKEDLQIENLPAYLHVAVRNRVLNFFEKERRYIPFEQLLHDNIHFQGDPADAVALQNDFLNAYKALVDSLPVKRRKIFKHYYEEGLSTEEISRRLELSRKTVQNQLHTAVSYLYTGLSRLFFLLILICI